MKQFVPLIIVLTLSSPVFPQSAAEEATRKHLVELVENRKERFEEFNKAIETKSGIFGRQTKKDLKAANEILVEVVKADNRIIFELQRLLEHKSYEKAAENFSSGTNEAKLEKYLTAIDNLNAKNKELQNQNSDLEKRAHRAGILVWLLVIGLAILAFLFYRERKKNTQLA